MQFFPLSGSHPPLVDSMDVEPMDTEGWLCPSFAHPIHDLFLPLASIPVFKMLRLFFSWRNKTLSFDPAVCSGCHPVLSCSHCHPPQGNGLCLHCLNAGWLILPLLLASNFINDPNPHVAATQEGQVLLRTITAAFLSEDQMEIHGEAALSWPWGVWGADRTSVDPTEAPGSFTVAGTEAG